MIKRRLARIIAAALAAAALLALGAVSAAARTTPDEEKVQQWARDDSSLDAQRKALREQLLKNRAEAQQRKAIANANATETPQERAERQRLYNEGAAQRGEAIIAGREAEREFSTRGGNAEIDAHIVGEWARDESNLEQTRKSLRDETVQSIRSGQGSGSKLSKAEQVRQTKLRNERRQAVQKWASGNADIPEQRKNAREHTRQKIGGN